MQCVRRAPHRAGLELMSTWHIRMLWLQSPVLHCTTLACFPPSSSRKHLPICHLHKNPHLRVYFWGINCDPYVHFMKDGPCYFPVSHCYNKVPEVGNLRGFIELAVLKI